MIVLQSVTQQVPSNGLHLEHPGELRLATSGRLVGLIAINSDTATTVELPLLGTHWLSHFKRMGLLFEQSDIPVLAPVGGSIRGFAPRLVIAIPAGQPKLNLLRGIEDISEHLTSLSGPVNRYDTELSSRLTMTLLAMQDARLELRS